MRTVPGNIRAYKLSETAIFAVWASSLLVLFCPASAHALQPLSEFFSASHKERDQIDRLLSDLPQGIRSPQVQKMDPASSPIVYIALRTTQPLIAATEFADKKIRRQLEGIAGVGGNESIQYVARCRAHRGWVACASGRRSDQHNHRQWPDLLTASHAAGGAGCLLDTR